MNVFEAKVCSVIVLGLGSMLMGMIPAWFSTRAFHQRPLLFSSLLCFGSGVLLATSLVHMLPEFRESFVKYSNYVELIFCGGFFFVFLIDEILHFFIGGEKHGHAHSSVRESAVIVAPLDQNNSSGVRLDPHYGTIEIDPLLRSRQPPYNPNFVDNTWDEIPSQLCHVTHKEPCHVSPVGTLSLLLALTVHALLEGLPIGLQNSASQVFLLLGAISSHKLIVAFCLGVELTSASNSTKCRHFSFIFTFTLASLVGIVIGMFITRVPKDISQLLFPVLQGLTGGTLLYVTVSEILPRERARWHKENTQRSSGLIQFLSVAAGFTIMTLLTKCLQLEK